ncbi:apolipoprotein A1/A4/E family protein [Sphingopyxis sp. PET50]|uniref:apolipoprotein A1/A4/E family protein n=1 Tax=Sphingopyxis sp. PET50 TaxID=2976533 RepID=UPI0021AF9E7A|nr:apolipoprotein A1/A4/E family protein [Sphingopyxis sp. PET50]
MTGHKKIVGLWQESGENPETDGQAAERVEASAAEAAAAPERDWLDPSTLAADDEAEDMEASGSTFRDRIAPTLLILLGLGWAGFAAAAATGNFARAPGTAEWPGLIATIAMPLTLLVVLWMALLRSSRSEQARFAKVAAALRDENTRLNQSMHSLGLHLADAQRQLAEQATTVQQLGLDTVARLTESSDKLATNASVIANAHDQLARSGDVALQRMDGLLAGLPRIDDVAQRLAGNFREAGLVAHQQGASLEAKLAALAEEAVKAAETGEASATVLQNVIGSLEARAKQAESELLAVSAQVTGAHETTLAQVTQVAAALHHELTSTVDTMSARLGETWQAFRDGVAKSAGQLDDRLAIARHASDDIGAQLAAHGVASEELAARITGHVAEIGDRLEFLDVSVSASAGVIGRAIDDTKEQLATFMQQTEAGNGSARQLISHAESLLLALDAVTREMDETLPHALDRIGAHGQATRTTLGELRPLLEASELVAQSTLSHVNAVQATLASNETQMAGHAERQQALVERINASLAEADAALAKLRDGADQFAEQGGAKMIATLGEVRQTADSAASQAQQTIEKLVAGTREAMQSSATEAIDAAFRSEIMKQLDAIGEASERAVAAANNATDRLMRQLITIMDTSASVEARAAEAEAAIAASDRDSLAKQVGLLTESLKSTAIDLTKILSSEVSDTAWDAYLKGDRGVFARRAVKLIENSEAKEILRVYQNDDAFHAAVNQFIHDFEAMLRLLMNTRDGSAISVTLLSSDIGKLYVALAQAIDRLRN